MKALRVEAAIDNLDLFSRYAIGYQGVPDGMGNGEHACDMAPVNSVGQEVSRQGIDRPPVGRPWRAAHSQGCEVGEKQGPILVSMQNIRLLRGQDSAQSRHAGRTFQADAQYPDACFPQARKPGTMQGLIRRPVENTGHIVTSSCQPTGKGGTLNRSAALDGVVGVDHHDSKRLFTQGHACTIGVPFILNRH
jgi:hypothetical protein